MRNPLRIAVAGIGLLTCASAFVHPSGAVKTQHANTPLFAGLETPAPVIEIFQRSCQNCHSERTEWPWYSYLPPLSWLVENDVHTARGHMNSSRWQDYTTAQQIELLGRLGAEVRSHQMPLPRYLTLHPDARPSPADIDQLYQWARHERRRLASLRPPQSQPGE